MRNICIESHVLNHPRRSGVMTYTEGLVNGLRDVDQENSYSLVYYSLWRNSSHMPGPAGRNFSKTVLRMPDRTFYGRQALTDRIALPLFFNAKKINIFHRTCGYTMPFVKNIFGILTVHDLRTLTIGDSFWAQNIEHYRKTINALNACVVVSECTKRDLVEHLKVDEQKMHVVYQAAHERFRPASEEEITHVRKKYNLSDPFFLSLGSVPRKNIDGIIRAFALSKAKTEHLLVLSCNYDVAKYRQLAESLGVANRLRILESLTDEDIVVLYSACQAFVFPSLYEGFGLPIVEAFQCKAPVITSTISSCPEVAGDAAILVDPNQPQAIAEAMDHLWLHPRERQVLIDKGIARGKMFTREQHARDMLGIYGRA